MPAQKTLAVSGLKERNQINSTSTHASKYIVFLGMYVLDSSHSLYGDSDILKAFCTFTSGQRQPDLLANWYWLFISILKCIGHSLW